MSQLELDGQQVSFLVPSQFAEELLARRPAMRRRLAVIGTGVDAPVLAHQALLVQRFISQPWRSAGQARYRIPVPQEEFMALLGFELEG